MLKFLSLLGVLVIHTVFLFLQVLTWPLTRMLSPGGMYYQHRDTISAQCQGAGFSIQIGHRVAGWFGQRWMQRTARQNFHPTRLIIWGPIHSGGTRTVFQLLIFGRGLSFATQPEPGTSSWAWPGPGLKLV